MSIIPATKSVSAKSIKFVVLLKIGSQAFLRLAFFLNSMVERVMVSYRVFCALALAGRVKIRPKTGKL